MAIDNSIPYTGLTRAKTVDQARNIERNSLDDVSNQINGLLSILKGDLSSKEESKKIDTNFKKLTNRLKAEQDASILMIKEMKRSGATEDEIIARLAKDAKERMKSVAGVKKSIEDLIYCSDTFNDDQRAKMSDQIALLKRSLEFQERTEEFQKDLIDLQRIQFDIQLSQQQKVKESLERSLNDLLEEDKKKRRQDELREKLEQDYRLEDKKFQKMRDKDAEALQKRREKEDKKASNKGSIMAAMLGPLRLITDPFLKLTKGKTTEEYFQSKFEKSLENRRKSEDESIKERQDKEDKERERTRDLEKEKNEFYIKAQMQLDELAGGRSALSPEFEQRQKEIGSQQGHYTEQEVFQKNFQKLSNSIVSGISSPFKRAKESLNNSLESSKENIFHSFNRIFTRYSDEQNPPSPDTDNILAPSPAEALQREIPPANVESILAPSPAEALQREIPPVSVEIILAPSPAEALQREIPPASVESILAPSPAEALQREIPPASVESVLAPSPAEALQREALIPSGETIPTSTSITSSISDSGSQEQFLTDLTNAEYTPLLEKISPNRNALLEKGGIFGASAVYLGNLLDDQLNEMTEGQDKKKGEGGLLGNMKGFLSKNGLSLMKLAAPLAVMAVGGIMIKKGLDIQKRDTEDAKKYFDEGNTARGVETTWLGDRARLTEENATEELGRTTGKTALMAGGTAAVGIGAAGVIAAGGALAGGAGLAGAGTAGLAVMGAAFPPALIAAAVAVGVTVIAKGTQEAFELGWDKNQANIQKELNSVIFDEDASVWEKIKASAASTWKGFTGDLAGGIREAGSVLDAETMIQNEKQIKFLQEQADAENNNYAQLLDLMQSEQFKALDKKRQEDLLISEGLYTDFEKMQQGTKKSLGEHLLTAGRTIGGFLTGVDDTTVEGARGKETARWEAETLKDLKKISPEDSYRLKQSQEYQDIMASSRDDKSALKAAYLKEQKDIAIARGELTKDGMAVQKGGFGKYFGLGDTGLSYKERKTGTDELDNEYRQTFEYSKRKAELMDEGKTAEEADLAVIAEQNQLYQDALTLRLKQSDDYKVAFEAELAISKDIKKAEQAGLEAAQDALDLRYKQTEDYKIAFEAELAISKDIKKAEQAGLKAAKANEKNMLSTNKLMKAKFTEVWNSVKNFAENIGGWFKDKFSAAGQGMVDLGKAIADGASKVWSSITDWASKLWQDIGEKFDKILKGLKDFGEGAVDAGKAGLDWLGEKATDAWSWLTGGSKEADTSINDGIVLKNGKVIEISPDDNVYATKNEPKVVRDQEAQAAMPSIPKTPAEFTDKNIVAMLQAILDKLGKMNIQPQVITSGGDINFDGLKMAGAL